MVRPTFLCLLVLVGAAAAQPKPGTVVRLDPHAKYDPTKRYTLQEFTKIVTGKSPAAVAEALGQKAASSFGAEFLPREKNEYGQERGPIRYSPYVQEYKVPVSVKQKDGTVKEFTSVVLRSHAGAMIQTVGKNGKVSTFMAGSVCYEVEPGEAKK